MRDYYEPRLVPRLLACHDYEARGNADACKKALKEVRPLAELNRIQPDVKIVGVQRGVSADEAVVDVEVAGKEDASQKNGKTKTDVYDLRLFRDGQIVGQWPIPSGGMGGSEDIDQWRGESRVPMSEGSTKTVHRFTVHLARRDAGQPVRLTAYAFNEDRVKSETAADESYKVPSDVTPAKARAYVITIGVNAYQNPKWKLGYAVKDAQDISGALQRIQGYEVVTVPLVSIDDEGSKIDQATKANIQAVLALLAGAGEANRPRLKTEIGAVIDKLQKVTPDDLVMIAFSGHGYTDPQSRFYLLPSDSGTESTVSDAVVPKFISSDELSQWLRDVDAGHMVMLIDACHSAASVPEGFKPGPMGDRGLGQLAYDKGMQILAATQADDVALESEKLGQGLLTYALIQDGLKAHKAADAGKPITIKTWLHYAEKRVPELYDEIQAGKLKLAGKDPIIDPAFYNQVARHAQTPALFDFYKQRNDPILQLTY
jgi:Caspase domain